MNKLPTVIIIGRPNVGKSTLFNRIVGFRQAVTSRESGTTRDRVIAKASWDNKPFILVDTAGLLASYYGVRYPEIEKQAQEQIKTALSEADMILFVVDARSNIVPEDKEVARLVRKYGKKTVLIFNKADNLKLEEEAELLDKLGFENYFAISSISGRRSGQLLDLITKDFADAVETADEPTKITIVGRPNVGKSTLFNALAGSRFAIVSDVPGTTRDSLKVEASLRSGEKSNLFEFIDTAGLRRRGKIKPGIEKFSVIRSYESILKSDIVLVVADAAEGITRGDAHLVELAQNMKKKVIVVLNKIDLLKNQSAGEIKDLNRFKFLAKLPVIAVSAKNRENLNLLSEFLLRD